MKLTELLKTQHQQVETLFEQLEGAADKEARALVDELASTLVAHTAIEREIAYPALQEALGAQTEIRRSLEEHALVEYAMQKLLRTAPGDESFHARTTVLRELFERHTREEEDDLIARADREIDQQRLAELGERAEVRFKDVRAQDIEKLLTGDIRRATPRAPTRRAPAKKAARRAPAKKAAAARGGKRAAPQRAQATRGAQATRSEEHTSELQSRD